MKTKTNVQYTYKSRDESFKPSYSMIGQCLLNKNESATVSKSKKNFGSKQGLSLYRKKFYDTVVFSFVCGNYCPIMD